jgi:hypothetical protein
MNYIEIKKNEKNGNQMICTHPMVTKIWEYGGGTISTGGWYRNICLMLKDNTIKKFQDNGAGKAIEEAERFLQSLPQ